MPFNLTEIDAELIQNDTLNITLEDVKPIDGFPTGGGQLVFQFPPVITSDAKKAKWELQYDAPGQEPQYMYFGGQPRTITIKAVYVVGGPPEGLIGAVGAAQSALSSTRTAAQQQAAAAGFAGAVGAVNLGWTAKRVAEEVSRWKSYFYMTGVALNRKLPIYRIVWHQLLPDESDQPSAWRGEGYNIKYDGPMIKDSTGEYPLITEVTVNLAQVSQIFSSKEGERMAIDNIPDTVKQQWY